LLGERRADFTTEDEDKVRGSCGGGIGMAVCEVVGVFFILD